MILIVVDDPRDWPLKIAGTEVVTGEDYIANPAYQDAKYRAVKVFNVCRSYRYQSTGYYVSLLAEARGHKPMPTVTTIQDFKTRSIVRITSEDVDDMIQRAFKSLKSDEFTLTLSFGRNVAKRYDALGRRLFKMFPAPFLRATFARAAKTLRWSLASIVPIPLTDIPADHWDFVLETAENYLTRKYPRVRGKRASRFDMAILYDPNGGPDQPSDEKAIDHFTAAAEKLGFRVEWVQREDYGRLAEFDALFIRETTSVNHHTYRFARRAAAEGLVVIDDPVSIFRCCNKVFLAELLSRHNVPQPRTMIVHENNVAEIIPTLGLPVILKQPDSSFSAGVLKAETADDLKLKAEKMLERSDLVLAQEFVPTDFDWRVGVLDRKPLYVAKYFMAANHWQIIKRDRDGGKTVDEGFVTTLPVEEAPREVIRTALKAANLIGDGLYGVDLKQAGKRILLMEINDNPSIEAGFEDKILGHKLYDRIMEVFLARVEERKQSPTEKPAQVH